MKVQRIDEDEKRRMETDYGQIAMEHPAHREMFFFLRPKCWDVYRGS